jgi:hypothetical protein
MDDTTQDNEPTDKRDCEATKNAGRQPAQGTITGPDATTKTLDQDAAQGSGADDAEAAKLNAKIQADAQMKFRARTAGGRFRTPRSKGK